jgi:hypothetical protein
MPGVSPEARLLRYFLAVADELNFTRAAERLGIAQPALSAQIRQLEAQLGVQLLERTTRSVRLTDAGRAVHDRGPAALAALEDVWEAARRAGRGETGRLRIAYSASAGYDTAPRLVEAPGLGHLQQVRQGLAKSFSACSPSDSSTWWRRSAPVAALAGICPPCAAAASRAA